MPTAESKGGFVALSLAEWLHQVTLNHCLRFSSATWKEGYLKKINDMIRKE